MTETNKALQGYYREIRGWLPCSRKEKDRLLNQFRENVAAYRESNPAAEFEDIRGHFGSPERIAGVYVEEMGTAELLRALRFRRRITAIIAATCAVILVTYFCGLAWAIAQVIDNKGGHIVEEKWQYLPIPTTEGDQP